VLFAMAEQAGYIERGQALHTAFGHLNVGGRKMRSRAGQVVLLDELLDDAVDAALKLAEARGDAPDMSERERCEVARKVGVGSLLFNDLRQDRGKDIEFDADVAARLEAGQGPYVQYAYCRLRGIASRHGAATATAAAPVPTSAAVSSEEVDLLRHLASLPGAIADAADRNAPHRVAEFLNKLAQLSNAFYVARPIRDAQGDERQYLLSIVAAAQRGFESAAALLHLELPERM
jgi:arginyl-tRNA synthetase